MMMENLPFLQTIGLTVLSRMKGSNKGADGEIEANDALTTCVVFFALSTSLAALLFFLLGFVRAGVLMTYFPRHVLLGSIGGVGLFCILTSLEVATAVNFDSSNYSHWWADLRKGVKLHPTTLTLTKS